MAPYFNLSECGLRARGRGYLLHYNECNAIYVRIYAFGGITLVQQRILWSKLIA